MLELKDVAKRYGGKRILEDVSHGFSPGLTLLTGQSGAGKSTLLRLIATAERPSSGDIVWNDVSIRRTMRAVRSTLGYAPQAVDLPDDLTAREFALHMAALKGLELKAAGQQFAAICKSVGLLADVDSRIGTFSGGMRRRLIFAQAMLGAPRLLALDEPTSELDSDTARGVIEVVRERARHAVVVMTTHLVDELVPYAACVLNVEAGSIRAMPGGSA